MYWLSCLPCHGDKGQGLTDEFRTTYPPEDQYCWARGCHGKMPYEQGFTLPTKIPAVIGPGSLAKFSDAAQLHTYIRTAMPFWKPGSLTEEESWGITAFILRQNGLWDGKPELNADVKIAGRLPSTTPAGGRVRNGLLIGGIGIGILLLLLLFIFILKKTRNTTTI
jgi:cytochrome c